jgi:hypothetical protein
MLAKQYLSRIIQALITEACILIFFGIFFYFVSLYKKVDFQELLFGVINHIGILGFSLLLIVAIVVGIIRTNYDIRKLSEK